MGDSLLQWRVSVGMFYCRCQKIRLLRKVSIHISFHFSLICFICRCLSILTDIFIQVNKQFLGDIYYFLILQILLIIAGDVERNPGPEHSTFRCRRFTIPRLSLFQKTRHLHPLNTHLLLNGNSNLSYDDNVILFEAVQKFIKDTARFNT